MSQTKPTYSKLNSVQDGVLVCVDSKKDLYKYMTLDKVKIGNKTLGTVLEEKDQTIKKLEDRIEKLEGFKAKQVELNKLNESESDF